MPERVTNAAFLRYLGDPLKLVNSQGKKVYEPNKSFDANTSEVQEDLRWIEEQTAEIISLLIAGDTSSSASKVPERSYKARSRANNTYITPHIQINGEIILELTVDRDEASIAFQANSRAGESIYLVIEFDPEMGEGGLPKVYYIISEPANKKNDWHISVEFDRKGNPKKGFIYEFDRNNVLFSTNRGLLKLKANDTNFSEALSHPANKKCQLPQLEIFDWETITIPRLDSPESVRSFIREQWMRFFRKSMEPYLAVGVGSSLLKKVPP